MPGISAYTFVGTGGIHNVLTDNNCSDIDIQISCKITWSNIIEWLMGFKTEILVNAVTDDKRILLSDPNYVANELNRLQSELQEVKVQMGVLQQTVNKQQSVITEMSNKGAQGTVYTRWGRSDCPQGNSTELVYTGYVGGSYYTATGAAANALCLPNNPTFGSHTLSQTVVSMADIYGAEFEEYQLFGLPHQDEDVPCAVCRNAAHSTVAMVPARTSCYQGWTEAYSGLLAAGHPTQTAATEFVCMDGRPEGIPGGSADNNGKLFYAVKTKCGSLQCPPYDNDQIVSCVVCMK
ncbi:uncharacterized protein [Argopecten irradians]|uniref:uncharacterized protein n=1 Tax=Argopecten irradians TaxID=31199 RepID=UPI00371D8909